MTRQPRLSSQSGIYHVMLRGVNRQQIFEDDDDYRKFIMILHDMTSPKDELKRPLPPRCAFYTYCLMPNHVHLLIQEKEEKLSKTVKQIASRYAMYYNNKYEHFGHLFQDRFKSEPVESYSYFLTLIRYIHQNPVAGSYASVSRITIGAAGQNTPMRPIGCPPFALSPPSLTGSHSTS